jgi:hypothetical protein
MRAVDIDEVEVALLALGQHPGHQHVRIALVDDDVRHVGMAHGRDVDVVPKAGLDGRHVQAALLVLDAAVPGVDAVDFHLLGRGELVDQVAGAGAFVGPDLQHLGGIDLRDQVVPNPLGRDVEPGVGEVIVGHGRLSRRNDRRGAPLENRMVAQCRAGRQRHVAATSSVQGVGCRNGEYSSSSHSISSAIAARSCSRKRATGARRAGSAIQWAE